MPWNTILFFNHWSPHPFYNFDFHTVKTSLPKTQFWSDFCLNGNVDTRLTRCYYVAFNLYLLKMLLQYIHLESELQDIRRTWVNNNWKDVLTILTTFVNNNNMKSLDGRVAASKECSSTLMMTCSLVEAQCWCIVIFALKSSWGEMESKGDLKHQVSEE